MVLLFGVPLIGDVVSYQIMIKNWEKYQQEVAAFFKSLDFNTEVESKIKGARGNHKIDVLVSYEKFGISFKWVIECKYWKNAVPKEKVLALLSVVQDVGADKGFLLSETGFQAGAINSAEKTNITLTNLKILKEKSKNELAAIRYNSYINRFDSVIELLRGMTWSEEYRNTSKRSGLILHTPNGYLDIMGKLSILEYSFKSIKKNDFPIIYDFKNGEKYLSTDDIEIFYGKLEEHLKFALKYYDENKNFSFKDS